MPPVKRFLLGTPSTRRQARFPLGCLSRALLDSLCTRIGPACRRMFQRGSRCTNPCTWLPHLPSICQRGILCKMRWMQGPLPPSRFLPCTECSPGRSRCPRLPSMFPVDTACMWKLTWLPLLRSMFLLDTLCSSERSQRPRRENNRCQPGMPGRTLQMLIHCRPCTFLLDSWCKHLGNWRQALRNTFLLCILRTMMPMRGP